MVGRLGPLFVTASLPTCTAGQRVRTAVRTQHAVSTSAENRQRRGDVEIPSTNYLQDAAGARNLVFDLAVTRILQNKKS